MEGTDRNRDRIKVDSVLTQLKARTDRQTDNESGGAISGYSTKGWWPKKRSNVTFEGSTVSQSDNGIRMN